MAAERRRIVNSEALPGDRAGCWMSTASGPLNRKAGAAQTEIPVRPLRRASSEGIWGRCSASRTTITQLRSRGRWRLRATCRHCLRQRLAATACAATNPWQPTAGCGLQGAQRVAGPRWKDADGGWGGQPGRSMSKSSKGISKVRNSSFLRERPLPKAKSHPPTAKTSNALMGLRRPARPGMRILKRFLQQALGLA
jgi:hypothetical protein